MFADPNHAGGRRYAFGPMIVALFGVLVAATAGCSIGQNNAYVSGAPMRETNPSASVSALPPMRFTVSPFSQTRQWLDAHPADPRTPALRARLGNTPAAEWLTGGPRDVPNLVQLIAAANRTRTVPILALYNIPGRDDGLTGARAGLSAAGYQGWIDQIATTIGNTPVVLVVEPDALWLADRQFQGNKPGLDNRLALLRYAGARLARNPAAHIYLDAGTSSGSVQPGRMAQLLRSAGASDRIGYAVNVSSFAPTPAITGYATAIRANLRAAGVGNPRYVVDTSRNGNPRWNNDSWCNPADRKVGATPSAHPRPAAPGLDANLWVKAPGTSDGSCGVGRGSAGGDFLPSVAANMIR